MSVEALCHCGAVRLVLPAAPVEVTECNCSICRRLGVLWAYYDPAEVATPRPGLTDTYGWDDRAIAFHRCPVCGCATHWSPVTAPPTRMGVNARLLDPGFLAGARVRHLDGGDGAVSRLGRSAGDSGRNRFLFRWLMPSSPRGLGPATVSPFMSPALSRSASTR